MKPPCKQCPFLKGSARGWLGGHTAQQTHDYVMSEQFFACHMTRHKPKEKMERCRGSIAYIRKNFKIPRDFSLAKQVSNVPREILDGVLHWKEFLEYHKLTPVK